jgi:hypothetical protein
MKRLSVVSIIVSSAILFSSCSSTRTPETVAKEWLNAVLGNGGNVSELTCANLQGPIEESLKLGNMDEDSYGFISPILIASGFKLAECRGEGSKYKTSNIKFVTLSEEGDKAHVEVTGELTLTCASKGAAVDTWPFDKEQVWTMVKEDGIWKFCDTKEP